MTPPISSPDVSAAWPQVTPAVLVPPGLGQSAPVATANDDRPHGTEHAGTPAATQTLRVLHLVNGEHYAGAERVQDLLARQLPRLGFDVGFACLKPGRFPAARESVDARLVELPMRGRLDLRVVGRLVELLRTDDYCLIHAHTPRAALAGRLAARRAGVPLVYHVHSPAGKDSTRHLANWVNTLIERVCLRQAERLIAVSPSVRRYMIERGFAADRVTCVPNGVPLASTIAERSPPRGTWTIGTAALFRPRKGTEVLLEAIAALRSRGVDVRLRAVGGFESPGYESSILCLAERLGLGDAVDWVGFTRNIDRELARMDLFVLPSLFGEGLPMVVLEAMATGLPVVASHVEGVPEAIHHQETGLLVAPGSVSQLAGAIEDFVTGRAEYATISRDSRQRQAEHFSDRRMAEGVAAIYREVLASTGAN